MDNNTRLAIDRECWRLLRDVGVSGPPVLLEPILGHLQLYRHFYDLTDPTFLERAKHKIVVGTRKLIDLIKKIRLSAVLLYDEGRIVLDHALPDIKREWPSFHEVTHQMLPWHRPYFYGDTAQTLNPDWQEMLEAEANYGAAALMFCGNVFTQEACDTKPAWNSVADMKARYGKSYHITLRRYVQYGPQCSMALLVSTAPWDEQPADQHNRWRHFVTSEMFAKTFGLVSASQVLDAVDMNVVERRGGLVADFGCVLNDDNGDAHEFHGESFYNRYYVMTLLVHLRSLSTSRIVIARPS